MANSQPQQITIVNKTTHQATTLTGQEISLSPSAFSVVELPVSPAQIKVLARTGNDLIITMINGETITIHGFFLDPQDANAQAGRNDLVAEDGSSLWLADLNSVASTDGTIDLSTDTALNNTFSSIDSLDPLYSDTAFGLDTVALAGMGPAGIALAALSVGAGAIALSNGGGNDQGDNNNDQGNGGKPPAPQISTGGITQNPDGTLTVKGTAHPGDTVTVTYPDGSSTSGTADANGNFSETSNTAQTTGNVTVTDTNPANNQSNSTSETWTDTTPPMTPAVGGIEQNPDGTLTVTGAAGAAEPGSTVTVTFPDGSSVAGTVNADGSYSITSANPENAGG
ncbi:MAG: BapA prefix-like domain-containing protein, partial [Burkholderiaceae bacterium]|nr:BapA prefix-like domain-containing protein [Burkholderiaceae bacterium]